MELLTRTLAQVVPVSAAATEAGRERLDTMTKPRGALGAVEAIAARLCGIAGHCPPPVPVPAAVAVFAADHGVHARGVTPWPQEVTAQMVANILAGGAVVNAFARQIDATVRVVDVGVAATLAAHPGLVARKIAPGTADMTAGPALTREQVVEAVEVGIDVANDLVAEGHRCLLSGDMGIANTTAAAALICGFTGADPVSATGRGTGVDDMTLDRKKAAVRCALDLHQPDATDPVAVLAAFGGLEHAAIAGLVLGGAAAGVPVLLDGINGGAAALAAAALAPDVLGYCLAGHRSTEPGHGLTLAYLGLAPVLDLAMRLGEGTGALLALPTLQAAARAMHEVATFDAAGVADKNG
jgi:nicotinate-nucleotide--dimethylbenzimidazole phosphoribosyltransferase